MIILTNNMLLFSIGIVLTATSLLVAHAIKLDSDGGYVDIVVKIADKVPDDECPTLIRHIQKLLAEGSRALHQATDHRVFIKSANVIVPSDWKDGKCQTVIAEASGRHGYRGADLLVSSGPDRLHGYSPFTQQSKGCGLPGDHTVYPYTFFTAWNITLAKFGEPGKVFVREWAKLRYGVFDELGFANDPLFPAYYISGSGQVLPTGSTNQPLAGRWVSDNGARHCDPRHDPAGCHFHPDASQNENIFCSLGYISSLPRVKKFCNRTTGSLPLAPTKQNVLCGGKLAGDVIEAHEDLSRRSLVYKTDGYIDEVGKSVPEVVLMREPPEKFVLIVETSSSMDTRGQWKWVNKAAQKFIRYDLPLHSNLAIVTFGNATRVEHHLTSIQNDEMRSRLADTIPDKYHLSRSELKCLLCAVKKAITDVLRNKMAGAHLVFITRGTKDTLSISDEQTIKEYVSHYNLRVSSILLPEQGSQPLAFYDAIAQMSGGNSDLIETGHYEASVKVYVDLMKAFARLLPTSATHLAPVIVHDNLIEMSGGYSSSTGNFTIDQTLGRDTRFGIYVHDEEDHMIRSVAFTDSKGSLYGPYTSMSSYFDIINLKTVNLAVGDAPPFDDPELLGTQWQYFIEWYEGESSGLKSAVRVSSRPRYGDDDILVKVWSTATASIDLANSQQPAIAFFAQVIKGGSPVLNAKVVLHVHGTLLDGAGTQQLQLDLLDNGNADADLMQNDGIYSRFLTERLSPGRYAFSVFVHDDLGNAFTIRSNLHSMPDAGDLLKPSVPCCGSRAHVAQEDRVPTGRFSRSHPGPVIHVLSAALEAQDLIPPGRVSDLNIQVLQDGNEILASWTAPGDDYDFGSITGYRFVVSRNMSTLLDSGAAHPTMEAFKQPDLAGTPTSHQFALTDSFTQSMADMNKDLYIGLIAFDEANNEGKMSNLVHLHLTPQGTAHLDIPLNSHVALEPENPDQDRLLIGVLCGTLIAISLLVYAAIWYFRHHRVSATKSGGVTANLVLNTSTDSRPNALSGKDVDGVDTDLGPETGLGTKPNELPKFTTIGPLPRHSEDDTPIYWSASQLLGQRSQCESSGQAAMTYPYNLDPIREEFHADDLDQDIYAQGLANYGYQMNQAMALASSTPMRKGRANSVDNILSDSLLANASSRLMQSVHEPVYVGYSPDASMYGTTPGRGQTGSRLPPKVPPKPSLNALLGFSDGYSPSSISQSGSSMIIDIYGSSTKRNITHV